MTELTYTGDFAAGDRVTVEEDRVDGSWEGAVGTVVKAYRQKGGIFAPERNVELVMLDDEADDTYDLTTEEGRAALVTHYEAEGEPWLADSDEYTFEAL